MQYRPEIDGLRALAVGPVVVFHAGLGMSGGFLGVDVFFVISGYLITAILLSEMASGQFRLWHFYARRARRLLPALFAVLIVTTVVAWVLLAPSDLERFGRSLVAVAALSSNVLFWVESGYFDTASELKPLLHTWSLAVEEQFYLLFPIVLLLGRWLGRLWLWALVLALAGLSFATAQVLLDHDTSAAFYLLPARAWELLAGALVALVLQGRPLPRARGLAQGLSALGLAMILWAMLTFDAGTPVPGVATLLPVLGVVLILIFAVPGTWVAWMLSRRLLVGVGLISYSTYLWHHPVFAFARYGLGHDPGPWVMEGLALVSFGLGWLSWAFIETPFRRSRSMRPAIPLGTAALGGMVAAGLGAVAVLSAGLLRPVPDSYRQVLASMGSVPQVKSADVLGPKDAVRVVLLGDSHALSFAEPLGRALADQGKGLRVLARTGCPPVRGLLRHDKGPVLPAPCHQWNAQAFQEVLGDPQLETVVLAARLTLYLESDRFDNGEGGREIGATPRVLFDGLMHAATLRPDVQRRGIIAARYRDEIEALLQAGKQVVVVYPVPEVGWDVAVEAWLRRGAPEGITLSTSAEVFAARNARAHALLDGLGHHPRLARVYPADVLCNRHLPGRCMAVWQNQAFYRDTNHLSPLGVAQVLPHLLAQLEAPDAPGPRLTQAAFEPRSHP